MRRRALWMLPVAVLLLGPAESGAQELEPGAYSISPVGVNLLVASYDFNRGDVAFDPNGPIENASARVHTASISYVRTLDFFGRSSNIGVSAPVTTGHLEGTYIGQFASVDRSGFRGLGARFAVNLYGAPAMSLGEFAVYRLKTNVGVSLVVASPLGTYDTTHLINVSSNRWSFKPEVGLSQAIGRWTLELYAGVWLFTDNDDFFGGMTRAQSPIASTQFHLWRTFRPGMWLAFDANYYTGGRTTVDGVLNLDLQRNSRFGATFSLPLDQRQSLKFAYSRGAYTTIGADFDAFLFEYQYLWGAGL